MMTNTRNKYINLCVNKYKWSQLTLIKDKNFILYHKVKTKPGLYMTPI